MNVKELRRWLDDHINTIYVFMDYEPTFDSDEALALTLGYWFHNADWDDNAYTFQHLGIDGMGSQIAAWFRTPDAPPHVVCFGSEGGRGVLARTLDDWAKIIAHAPSINEYPSFKDNAPACIDAGANWKREEEGAEEALESYRAAVTAKFGAIPELGTLLAGLEPLNEEFLAWIASRTA